MSARADKVCADHAAQLAALPDPRSTDEAVSLSARRIEIARDEVTALRRLGVPDRLVAAMARQVEAANRMRIASISGDTESAQGAVYIGSRAQAEARASARQLGLKRCP